MPIEGSGENGVIQDERDRVAPARRRFHQQDPYEVLARWRVASRCRIGLIVLATDHTIEAEWRHVIRLPGVAVYESRISNSPEINPTTLAAMEKDLGNRRP